MSASSTTAAVLGAKGMLGSDLVSVLNKTSYSIITHDLPEFDITNPLSLEQVVKTSDIIINCAAYTNVDQAENEPEIAHTVNASAVGCLGHLAVAYDKYVIHISTDFVYDGTKVGAYNESDVPNPVSAYGKTKYDGEKLLAESHCRHCILRIQWTYGNAGENFITKICKRAQNSSTLRVVADQIGSPTHTKDVAKAISCLINDRVEGLFLYASEGYASRFEVAEFIVKTLNLNVSVTPCVTADFPSPAKRPLNSRFDCEKIAMAVSPPRSHWQQSLADYLRT